MTLTYGMETPANAMTHILIGGINRAELPIPEGGVVVPMLGSEDFLLPPMPNQIFTRDSWCWIYGGVTLNLAAIDGFHPDFAQADFPIWFGDPMVIPGLAPLEGDDLMPVGNIVVLIGMGARTSTEPGRGGSQSMTCPLIRDAL